MENELCMIGFKCDEYTRAVQYAIKYINEKSIIKSIIKEDGEYVPIENCCNMNADDYTEKILYGLYKRVEFNALLWCLNELHSRK